MQTYAAQGLQPSRPRIADATRIRSSESSRFVSQGVQTAVLNHLLSGLPSDEAMRLRHRFTRVEFSARQYVHAAGERIAAAIFPEKGWLYQIVTVRNGDGSEAGIVGAEGMVGVPLLFGADRSVTDLMAHATCTALRMEAGAFRASMEDCPTLHARLMLYVLGQHAQSLQRAACNAHHSVDQRLARTILDASDRADGRFLMTHELLSVLLGVRRAGITVAAGELQRAGLVRYSNGVMEVLDRARLELRACECRTLLVAQRHGRTCDAL